MGVRVQGCREEFVQVAGAGNARMARQRSSKARESPACFKPAVRGGGEKRNLTKGKREQAKGCRAPRSRLADVPAAGESCDERMRCES